MRRNPNTTLLIRTCKTRKQLELANLLSRRCVNRNSKLRGRNKLLARLSRENTHVLLLPHSSQHKQRALPLESWRKYVQPWSGTLHKLTQEEHRTRINARAKIDQQHKRRTRKELTFTRTHRNDKLTQGNTRQENSWAETRAAAKPNLHGGKQAVWELKWRPQKSSAWAREWEIQWPNLLCAAAVRILQGEVRNETDSASAPGIDGEEPGKRISLQRVTWNNWGKWTGERETPHRQEWKKSLTLGRTGRSSWRPRSGVDSSKSLKGKMEICCSNKALRPGAGLNQRRWNCFWPRSERGTKTWCRTKSRIGEQRRNRRFE
jgi:hypothetical protein